MHLDALGGAAPVDGAESALPELVAVVEVVGRLQELLEAVDLPWILYTPALRCPRWIRSSNSSSSVTGRFISSTDRDIDQRCSRASTGSRGSLADTHGQRSIYVYLRVRRPAGGAAAGSGSSSPATQQKHLLIISTQTSRSTNRARRRGKGTRRRRTNLDADPGEKPRLEERVFPGAAS
jgi:hypothetical protein